MSSPSSPSSHVAQQQPRQPYYLHKINRLKQLATQDEREFIALAQQHANLISKLKPPISPQEIAKLHELNQKMKASLVRGCHITEHILTECEARTKSHTPRCGPQFLQSRI